jgi:6,7-dimethyl-8-ribityllumazine synthase
MASSQKNLSDYSSQNIPNISHKKFAVIVSEWNEQVTEALMRGCIDTLLKEGANEANIVIKTVPGSYELTLASQWMAQDNRIHAVICLGCIIKGETKHNEFIAHAIAWGLTEVSLKFNKPVIFGVLTPDTLEQALDRAGGQFGNKGDEAAITAIKMLGF